MSVSLKVLEEFMAFDIQQRFGFFNNFLSAKTFLHPTKSHRSFTELFLND